MVKIPSWSKLSKDKVRNWGDGHEFFAAYELTGEIRWKHAPTGAPDILVKNAAGKVVATVESKTGCGTLDSKHDLATFKRMPHCTHVAYCPRFFKVDGKHPSQYTNAERPYATVVVSYATFIKLMEKYRLIRDVEIGPDAPGEYKVGCQNFLPTGTGKTHPGTSSGASFLEELYSVGESLEDFKARLNGVNWWGN